VAYILYENGKKIGEISEWAVEAHQPVYKDVLGKKVLSVPKNNQCTFVSPKPINRKSQLTVIHDGRYEFILKINKVTGATFVSALIVSQQDL
jgi:hypothetical protein